MGPKHLLSHEIASTYPILVGTIAWKIGLSQNGVGPRSWQFQQETEVLSHGGFGVSFQREKKGTKPSAGSINLVIKAHQITCDVKPHC